MNRMRKKSIAPKSVISAPKRGHNLIIPESVENLTDAHLLHPQNIDIGNLMDPELGNSDSYTILKQL